MAIPDPPTDGKSYALRWVADPGEWEWVAINPLDAAEDLDFNGRRGRNAAASNLAADYVTRQELESLVAGVTSNLALKVDGTNQMLADANIGGNKLIGVDPGTADTDGVNKGQMDDADEATLAAAKTYTDEVALQGSRFPIGNWSRFVAGTYSFTVGVDCPAWVTTLYLGAKGGAGAAGGSKPPGTYTGTVWWPGGDGGDGGELVQVLTVADGDVITIVVGDGATGGGGGGTTSNEAKDHCSGGGGGGGTKITHNGIDYIAGGGGGGGGARAGTYSGYGASGFDGGGAMADSETNSNRFLVRGEGADIGSNLFGGTGGAGGNSSTVVDDAEDGGDGHTSHTSQVEFHFLFQDRLDSVGVGGAANVTGTSKNTRGGSGTAGGAFLRW